MGNTLQVGIVGASAGRGWARESHVPAVRGLAGLELAAVATNTQASADAAAKAFGARAAHADAAALIQDRGVDLVAVCVKAPDHLPIVLAALRAGKPVYCEWPLGRNTAEAEEIADAAGSAGVHAVVGLQTRMNPAGLRAREMILSGTIGRVLSAHVLSSTVGFGAEADAYSEDAANGVTLVTIQGGHTVDFAIEVLGGLADLAALATTQYPGVHVGGPGNVHGSSSGGSSNGGADLARTTPDHLLLQARLAGGGALSVEVAGGRPAAPVPPFRLEVIGTKGTLILDGGAPRGFQSGRMTLLLDGVPQSVDEGEAGGMPDTAANVAGMYAALRDDIGTGASTAPDFHHAVRLARLVGDALASARTGVRTTAADWPMQ